MYLLLVLRICDAKHACMWGKSGVKIYFWGGDVGAGVTYYFIGGEVNIVAIL